MWEWRRVRVCVWQCVTCVFVCMCFLSNQCLSMVHEDNKWIEKPKFESSQRRRKYFHDCSISTSFLLWRHSLTHVSMYCPDWWGHVVCVCVKTCVCVPAVSLATEECWGAGGEVEVFISGLLLARELTFFVQVVSLLMRLTVLQSLRLHRGQATPTIQPSLCFQSLCIHMYT